MCFSLEAPSVVSRRSFLYLVNFWPEGLLTRREGYPSTHTFPLYFDVVFTRLRSYSGRRVSFSIANTPDIVNPSTRVNFLIVSRPFVFNRALS